VIKDVFPTIENRWPVAGNRFSAIKIAF